MGGEVNNVRQLAEELCCKVESLPTTYLGLPLGEKHKAATIWDGVEEFSKKLSIWKRQYISKGGTVTLIRSTISNLPIYLLSLFRKPLKVKERLEKMQRSFLWGESDLPRKFHLGNWKNVFMSKEQRGLGIRKLDLLNRALLRKWLWRFAAEDDRAVWKMCIKEKYTLEHASLWSNTLEVLDDYFFNNKQYIYVASIYILSNALA